MKTKAILLTLWACLTVSMVQAQKSNAKLTASPFPFTGNDEVTFTFEVLDGKMKGYTGDVWIWAWVPNTSIGAPSNENPAGRNAEPAKVTRIAPDKYQIKFVPAQFYGVTALQLVSGGGKLGMLLKGRDWSDGQTEDLLIAIDPPKFESPVVRAFPKAFTAVDIVTIFYDSKLDVDASNNPRPISDPYLQITLEGIDKNGSPLFPENYEIPVDNKVKLVSEGNGVYSITFVPNSLFGIKNGEIIQKLNVFIRSLDGSKRTPAPPNKAVEIKVY